MDYLEKHSACFEVTKVYGITMVDLLRFIVCFVIIQLLLISPTFSMANGHIPDINIYFCLMGWRVGVHGV